MILQVTLAGVIPLASSTMQGMFQGRGQMKSSTWSSSLGFCHGAKPPKNTLYIHFCLSVHAAFSLQNKQKVTVHLVQSSGSRSELDNTCTKKEQWKENQPFLTCHSDEVGAGVNASYCVPGFTEIIPTVSPFDVSDGEILTGHSNPAMTLPVPGVASFGVSIADAAQGHCTVFHWWTRGIHWHEGKSWSIWWRTKGIISFIGLQFPPNVSSFYYMATLTKPTTQYGHHRADPRATGLTLLKMSESWKKHNLHWTLRSMRADSPDPCWFLELQRYQPLSSLCMLGKQCLCPSNAFLPSLYQV